eukprot:m.497879 g.497879  ORF g.497879 m.497879 type:complete len:400 (+) comp21818_c1_seq3:220-1419(+)
MSFFRKSFSKVFKGEKPANGLQEPDGEFEDPSLSLAVSTDPSIHMTKSAAWFGRSHRRYFVLHRDVHKLAYYARPFVPPQKGILKGVINLGEVVDVNAFGCKLELHIAKGRSVFKLVADTDKIARDWAALIKMEAHLSGLDNPLNKAVQDTCRDASNDDNDNDLYTEYGGFKFANDQPELYTDYDPLKDDSSDGPTYPVDDDEGNDKNDEDDDGGENYNTFTPNVADDAGYLDQLNPVADAETAAEDAADNYGEDFVPPEGAPVDTGYLDHDALAGGDETAADAAADNYGNDFVAPADAPVDTVGSAVCTRVLETTNEIAHQRACPWMGCMHVDDRGMYARLAWVTWVLPCRAISTMWRPLSRMPKPPLPPWMPRTVRQRMKSMPASWRRKRRKLRPLT